MREFNPDYITVLPALNRHGLYFCAAIRKYSAPSDDYITVKCSRPMKRTVAESLAACWAAALQKEIR